MQATVNINFDINDYIITVLNKVERQGQVQQNYTGQYYWWLSADTTTRYGGEASVKFRMTHVNGQSQVYTFIAIDLPAGGSQPL